MGPGRGTLTEADVCLFTTLLRWDPAYSIHFKCVRRIKDLPHLQAFLERFLALPGVVDTVNMDHIMGHYYWSHAGINPCRIVPLLEPQRSA